MYSVVIPVYNSRETLEELLLRLQEVLKDHRVEYIFVDDGSMDGSWEVLLHLQQQYAEIAITGIRLAANFGQDNATICGMSYANGRYIITLDDDLQHPPEELPALIRRMAESDADIVYGIFPEKKHSALRNMGIWILSYWSKRADGRQGTASAFRLMKRSLALQIIRHQHYFIRIEEVVSWYTKHIRTQEVQHHPRTKGSSGYGHGKLLHLATDMLFYYSSIPYRILFYAGLLTFFSGLALLPLLYFVRPELISNEPSFRLLPFLAVFTGLNSMGLGVLCRYLFLLLSVRHKKYGFLVAEIRMREDMLV